MTGWWGRRGRPARTGLVLVTVLLALLAASWGVDAFAPRADLHADAPRAVWMTHRWVDRAPDDAAINRLAWRLAQANVTDVYVHVGPLDAEGRIATTLTPHAQAFVAALHQRLPDLRVQAWLGQVEARGGGKLDLGDTEVRAATVRTGERFLRQGFDGIHYDIEPIWDGDERFLALLEATAVMVRRHGGVLSVAAEELPVFPGAERVVRGVVPRYHPWTVAYHRRVARHVDQIAVMTYDNAMPLPHLYRRFVATNTRRLAAALPHDTALLIGVPSYAEWNLGHWPAENVGNAVSGLRRGLARIPPGRRDRVGWALYADWHTEEAEWAQLR